MTNLRSVIKDKTKKKTNLKLVGKTNDIELPRVVDVIKGAPVPDTIFIPAGWRFYNGEIIKIGENKEKVSLAAPVLIKEILIDVNDNTEHVALALFRDNHWTTETVTKEVVANARLITTLSNKGFPVTSLNSKHFIKYFEDFETTNRSNIPKGKTSSHLGWQKGNGFLLGNDYINPKDSNDKIVFRGDDIGEEQTANAFRKGGTYGEWIRVANKLFDYPKVIASLYFSLVPPFLDILGAANFTVDWSGETSKGKTTTLRCAGSCWGSPNESNKLTVVHTWCNTLVWVERIASLLNGLPLILDDTKNIGLVSGKAGPIIDDVIYKISTGQGKGRGTEKGTQTIRTFKTVLLSSGEQAATDFTNRNGGSRARVITLWGSPFGAANKKTAALVNDINQTLFDNYGFAGEKVVKFIVDHQEDWPLWKDMHRKFKEYYSERAGQNSVANRMSEYFATLAIVIIIVHAAMPELKRDTKISEIIDHLWACSISGAEEADRAKVAFVKAYEWAVANEHKFYGREQTTNDGISIPPHDGWAGAWKKDRWNYIAFQPAKLESILEQQEFDFKASLKTWKDRGWLETDKTGIGKNVRMNNNTVYSYCLKKTAIDKIMGVDSDSICDDD